jgi:hypothetical protein
MIKTATLTSLWPFGASKTKIKIYGKPQNHKTSSTRVVSSLSRPRARKFSFAKLNFLKIKNLNIKLSLVFAAGIVGILVFNLLTVNFNIATGYKISTLQNKVADLKDENKRLMLKSSEVGSITAIQENFLAENFVPASSTQFIAATPSSLGMK